MATVAIRHVGWQKTMVRSCCVVKCANRSNRGSDIEFYQFPKIIYHQGEVSERRYRLWLSRINRKDLITTGLFRPFYHRYVSKNITSACTIVQEGLQMKMKVTQWCQLGLLATCTVLVVLIQVYQY